MKCVIEFFKISIQDFVKHRCGLHAAGLTYFTILAVVPMLCLLMVAAKMMGAGDFARERLNGYVDTFIASIEKGAAADSAAAAKGDAVPPDEKAKINAREQKRIAQRAVAEQLREFVNPLFDRINEFDISTFGWVGFAMLLWTVISTFGQIEASMNEIWQVPRPRSLLRRCFLFLFIAGVLPLLVVAALSVPVLHIAKQAIDATMGATVYTKWAGDAFTALLDSKIFSFVFSTFFVTLAFAFILSFMPHCKVSFRAALEGGLATAVLFCVWIHLCTAAQIGIGRSSVFYGSFATPVILLAWVYMSWQIVLLGASFTHAFQCIHNGGSASAAGDGDGDGAA